MRRASTWLALLLVACGGSPESPEPPATAETPETMHQHMLTHYANAAALREVVIVGELSLLGMPADTLSRDAQHAALPPTAAPFVERMNQAARRAGDARTLDDASRSVAEVAAACGACHAAHDVQIGPSPIGEPSEMLDEQGHMRRHHWATAKLWDGLVRPSWEDWKTGADALSEKALFPAHVEPMGAGPETAQLLDALHAAGKRAEGAVDADPAAKAAIFGEVIATCAGCHSRSQPVPSGAVPPKP